MIPRIARDLLGSYNGASCTFNAFIHDAEISNTENIAKFIDLVV